MITNNYLHTQFIHNLKYIKDNLIIFTEKWKFNSLSGLVQYFTEKQGKYVALGSPNINLLSKTNSDKSDGSYSFYAYLF